MSYAAESALPSPKPKKKTKKNPPRKKFLIFPETELSRSNIKKFLIFSQKKAFLMFPKTEPCTFQLILQEELSKPKNQTRSYSLELLNCYYIGYFLATMLLITHPIRDI